MVVVSFVLWDPDLSDFDESVHIYEKMYTELETDYGIVQTLSAFSCDIESFISLCHCALALYRGNLGSLMQLMSNYDMVFL